MSLTFWHGKKSKFKDKNSRYMGQCAHCGTETNHPFNCNYCQQSHCSEHRLPEKHNCPMQISGTETSLSGNGPQTKDRRSTHRKRVERVREKQTSKQHKKTDESLTESRRPRSKGDYRKTAGTDTLTCPTCREGTDEVFECEECGQKVCPACVGKWEHECPAAVTKDTNKNETEDTSMLSRILGFFR